jgi:protein TonB
MTHQISLPPPLTYYGAFEFKQRLHKFTTIGLTLAAFVYCILLGSYWLSVYIASLHKQSPKVTMGVIDPKIQPTSLEGHYGIQPEISVTSHPGRGVPVPVPDIQVSTEQTIATQKQMSIEGTSNLDNNVEISPGPGLLSTMDETPLEPWVRVEKEPILVKRINPQYPEIARALGIEGRVWAKAWIDKEGKIRQVVIIKSDSEIFSRAVTEAVQQWIYTPAFMSKGPVAVWVSLPFVFKLNK